MGPTVKPQSGRRVAVMLLVACVVAPAHGADAAIDVRVDGERLNQTMETMKTFGGTEGGGSERVAYSRHNRDALDYLAGLMQGAGMRTHIDVAGNLVGRRDGRQDLPPLVLGSHIDTVPNGGHYDGIVGVMAAIEAARTLSDAGLVPVHPLEVVVWSNEEGGKTGSRSWNGSVEPREMELPSLGERTLGEGIAFLGGDPARLGDNERKPGDIAAYLELHVEQGAILDRDGIDIGVVEGIVGIKRWNLRVAGFTNHAGTTPMAQRRDALYAAAQFVVAVRDTVLEIPGSQVATVGRIAAEPGAPNVIPGAATLSLEIRDLEMAKIDRVFELLRREGLRIGQATDTSFAFEQFYESPAAPTAPRISAIIEETAGELGLSNRRMPSGAGHDAQSIAPLAPIGMIFVPSRDGISHAPDEFTSPGDIENGANVLLRTLLKLDAAIR